jgi:hypothetical protein
MVRYGIAPTLEVIATLAAHHARQDGDQHDPDRHRDKELRPDWHYLKMAYRPIKSGAHVKNRHIHHSGHVSLPSSIGARAICTAAGRMFFAQEKH